MSRVVIVLSLLLASACPGFSINDDDSGPRDLDASLADSSPGDIDDVGLDASYDAELDAVGSDAGACVLGELCNDSNACTQGERCDESGCGGGSIIACMGTSARCEGDVLIEEALTGSCNEATGCMVDEIVSTPCPFSCVASTCTSCRTTDWVQSSLPFVVRDSATAVAQFAIDEEGGQHILFPTERLEGDFLMVAVDYAYRSGDGATWEITPIKPPGNHVPALFIALHHEEAHFLILAEEDIVYWRPEGGGWVEEAVPGVGYRDHVDLVVRPDGEPHVIRSSFGLMHAQRSPGGVWTEERVDSTVRPRELSAALYDGSVRVVFREQDENLGFADFDGSDWVIHTESVGERVGHPEFAIAPDGTLVTSYVVGDGDIGVGTVSTSGVWSNVLLTGTISRVGDEHSIAIDRSGGTHIVFQGIFDRATHYAYRRPGGTVFTFLEIVRGTELGFNLKVDERGKLRMVSQHVLDVNQELRFSTRQTCL